MPTCPKCKGDGTVMMAFRQSGYDRVQVACPVCKGTGRKPYYNPPTT